MEIMETPLGVEIEKVINENVPELYYWSATIHSKDYNHDALKVINIDDVRNYESKFCQELTITLFVPAGKYQYRLMPYLHQTEVTLHRFPIRKTIGGFDPDIPDIAHERYTAVIDQTDAPYVESNDNRKFDEFALDLSNAVMVRMRLLPKAMERFRLRTTGGIFRKVKVEDVIKNILITNSDALDLPGEYKPKGVDMVPPKDKRIREHFLLPHGIKATDAPAYVHKHCGGVYSNGFSYFYQNDYWFVWPTFDHTRFNEVEDTLTIINIPENQYPGLDRTWRKKDKSLIVLSTSTVTSSDSSEHNQHTLGNGTRFTIATPLKEGTVDTKGNKATYSRGAHNNEFTIAQRKNSLNNVTTTEEHITDNRHYIMSKMTVRNGTFIVMRWDNSSPNLIKPGMQARIMYLEKDNVVEKYGVVIGTNNNTSLVGQAVTASQHVATTDIILFTERVLFDLK